MDAVIWATPATQAWRRSEAATWTALPGRLRARSLLPITRADLVSETDLARARERVRRESAGWFREVLAIATPDTAEAWHESRGAALTAAIEETLATEHEARQADMLGRYAPAVPLPPPPPVAPPTIIPPTVVSPTVAPTPVPVPVAPTEDVPTLAEIAAFLLACLPMLHATEIENFTFQSPEDQIHYLIKN